MNDKKSPYIKISSLFTKSAIILFVLIILINVVLIEGVFKKNSELGIDKYSEIIDESLKYKDNSIYLTKECEELLKKNNLWFQMVDNSLNEVLSYNKPSEVPSSYRPIEFIHYYKYDIANSSVFIFEKKIMGQKYSYFLGFPLEVVGKYNIQYDTSIVNSLLNGNFIYILVMNLLFIILFSYFYFSKKIGYPLQKIINSIVLISKGDYNINIQEKGLYKEIYRCINELTVKLKKNKLGKELLDKSREKWISYISHDLKTPLSSIKGFAEIMKEDDYSFTEEEIKQYSSIMYDKAVYMEELLEDLNLIQKLKNSVIPLNIEKINIVKFIKELKKEILLNPNYFDRNIDFISYSNDISVNGDAKLLKRVFSNFIINFLIYNDKGTNISIEINENNNKIEIIIKDNGRGISSDELPYIFEQYYRGTNTNTNTNPNGSGLGMAIAYEIVKLHKGECKIESKLGLGTKLIIKFS